MQTIQAKAVSYLRPDQIEDMEGEREQLSRKLNNPNIQDKGAVADQLRRLDHQLETQRPRPYESDEIDAAVRKEKELREQWLPGMLSHQEMRAAPPGATDRHIQWERKNKRAISEWQNVMRRLNSGSDAREVASIERFRPTTNSMNLDNSIVQTKQFFMPPEDAARGVTFNDEDLARLRKAGLAEKVALFTNEERAQLKAMFSEPRAKAVEPQSPVRGGKRKVYAPVRQKRQMSPEHLAVLKAGRDAYIAKKAAEKEAA